MLVSIIGFLIILGPLVIVHELGHYFFARLFGVRAEVFSVGFGPKIWSKKIGETEWRLSWVPLGGYVRLLGEDRDQDLSPAEQARALHRAAPWKRFFIFAGGPLFNFLWAVLVFMTILVLGEQQFPSYVGRVVSGSYAEKVGFKSGDRILAVDGKPVTRFDEVLMAINAKPRQPLAFQIQRTGALQPMDLSVQPEVQPGYSQYGEQTDVGAVDGIFPTPRLPSAGVSNPTSPAARAGLKTGDQIIEWNGVVVRSWEQLEELYNDTAPSSVVAIGVQRAGAKPIAMELTKPAGRVAMSAAWGLYSSELFVDKAVPGSPAETAGLRSGDRLVSVDAQPVESFFSLRSRVQTSGEKTGKVPLQWERDGKIISAEIVPTATSEKDPLLKKTTQFTVGVMPMLNWADVDMVIERTWNPFVLLYEGTSRMLTMTGRTFVSIGKMFTGDVSVKTLGGPLMIGKVAGESLTRGIRTFLATMAMLSIGLGVLNILPVPVLDGGHILLLGVEVARRKPLTLRQMEVIQSVGLFFILLLMGLALKNDISRFTS